MIENNEVISIIYMELFNNVYDLRQQVIQLLSAYPRKKILSRSYQILQDVLNSCKILQDSIPKS